MKKILDFELITNIRLNESHVVLELQSSEPLPLLQPGQFVEVLVSGNPQVFLRRPFSIHDVIPENNVLRLFIKIVGKGTATLASLSTGAIVNIILPLGKGFRISAHNKILLAGGGCGIAPLLFLARRLSESGYRPQILMGGRSAVDVLLLKEFSAFGDVFTITEDGSHGEKGLITQHSLLATHHFDFQTIYACGPTPMLKALDELATRFNVECQVSLENTMACGIGACLCCVVKTTTGHRCVCTDGPVFDTKELAGWHQPMVKCDL